MSDLLFIRHAETDMAGRFCGHSDPDLNATGNRQLGCIVDAIAPLGIRRLLSSDLRRAARTASAIGHNIGIKPEFRPDLREMYFGKWEGLTWQEIEDRFPLEADRWLQQFPSVAAPAGESYAEFTTRIDTVLVSVLREAVNETTAIITHRGVIRYALTRFFNFSEEEAWTKTAAYGAVVAAPIHSFDSGALA